MAVFWSYDNMAFFFGASYEEAQGCRDVFLSGELFQNFVKAVTIM
jgi:hypothetical protein